MFWESNRDANMRLSDTIVMHGRQPVYVRGIEEDGTVVASSLENPDENFRFEYTRESIDTRPVELGYCKVRDRWIYYMRPPSRRYKQGLSIGYMMAVNYDGVIGRPRAVRPPRLEDLHKTITNQFDSFSEALVKASQGEDTPFHRRWLLRNDDEEVKVHYRGRVVGKVVDGEVVLDDGKAYLREHLEECAV